MMELMSYCLMDGYHEAITYKSYFLCDELDYVLGFIEVYKRQSEHVTFLYTFVCLWVAYGKQMYINHVVHIHIHHIVHSTQLSLIIYYTYVTSIILCVGIEHVIYIFSKLYRAHKELCVCIIFLGVDLLRLKISIDSKSITETPR